MDKIRKTKAKMIAKYPSGLDRVKDVCKLLVTIVCIKKYRLAAKLFIGGYSSDHWMYKYYPKDSATYFRKRYGSINKAKRILL